MKKIIFVLVLTVFAGSLWASSGEKLRSLYDVVAPVLNGNPAPVDREVGQIFYDIATGGFKGVNKNGGIDILTNVVGGTSTALPKANVQSPAQVQLVFDPETFFATVVFLQENYDANNMYNPNTGLFTAPVAGVYTLSTTISIAKQIQSPDGFTIAILKNGTEYTSLQSDSFDGNPNGFSGLHMNNDFLLQAGDTLAVVVSVEPPAVVDGFANFKLLQ